MYYGIFTGKFENMEQVNNVIKKGGLLESISEALDWGIKKSSEKGILKKSTAKTIQKGKNVILETINNNIEKDINSQMKTIENIDKNILQWEKYYNNKDFKNMDKYFNRIEKDLDKIMPIENIIKKARQIENLHILIKNKGKNFNLQSKEIELAKKLI